MRRLPAHDVRAVSDREFIDHCLKKGKIPLDPSICSSIVEKEDLSESVVTC